MFSLCAIYCVRANPCCALYRVYFCLQSFLLRSLVCIAPQFHYLLLYLHSKGIRSIASVSIDCQHNWYFVIVFENKALYFNILPYNPTIK